MNGTGAEFLVGSASEPHAHNLDIVLGRQTDSGRAEGTPFLGGLIIQSGQLILIGAAIGTPWTILGESAFAGDSSLQLQGPVDWQVR